MGRKTKVGKQRKDRFYKLAKETGYRSRAAFKLIQLNRKFEFLQRSKVCVDLCSAPGGWLQVAQKFMPVSSVIVGIDLVPIKPLHNVITFQADITTSKCRSLLSKELKTWKADVILNDGAPNVGKSWIHDAYAQIRLTLSAVQLASEFLMKGGWFVTKVFRCKDYNALVWLLSKLFKKVHATKPQASRHESAEIFIVCQKFLAPDYIDPKFFDPSYLFEDIAAPDAEKKKKAELLKPESAKKKAKPEGYAEGDYTLYHKLNASKFIKSVKHIELLSDANELVLDTDEILNDPLTTDDIKELCKDIKVLGRKDILELIAWRRKLRKKLYPDEKTTIETEELDLKDEDGADALNEDDGEDDELAQLKRKKKKILKERRKLNERMSLKMVCDNDLHEEDLELFQLKSLKNRKEIDRFQEITMDEAKKGVLDSDEDEDMTLPKRVHFERDSRDDYDFEDEDVKPDDEDDEISQDGSLGDDETNDKMADIYEDEDGEEQGLLVDLDDRPRNEKNSMFFQRESFVDEQFMDDEDEKIIHDEEMGRKSDLKKRAKRVHFEDDSDQDIVREFGDDDDDDDDSEEDSNDRKKKEDTRFKEKCKRKVKLDPGGLALGTMMLESKKKRREIEDAAWNRYMHADQDFLPSWFKKDEEAHFHKPIPVPVSVVNEYKQKLQEIDARPMKRVVEAKARKRKRAQRKLERARKKAESLTDAPDMSEKEKMATIRGLYKKALKENKKDVTYVVAKKGKINRKPGAIKGRYKLVDSRMKKDRLKEKKKSQNTRRKPQRKEKDSDGPPPRSRGRSGPGRKPSRKSSSSSASSKKRSSGRFRKPKSK